MITYRVLRAVLAIEGVGAFVLWALGLMPWYVVLFTGTGCLLCLWCTYAEPHGPGQASERCP